MIALFRWSTPIPRDGYPRPSHPASDLYRVADVAPLRAWLDAHGYGDATVIRGARIRVELSALTQPDRGAQLDDRANMDATVWHSRQAGAVCEPPAYDCVPPEEPAAKGCHGCGFALGMACTAITPASPLSLGIRVQVEEWITNRLGPDLLTPKPNAPECPGRVSNSGN